MKMNEETTKKLQEMQAIEATFQNLIMQKQAFQLELNEVSTAISELEKAKGDVFKVLGQIMVKSDAKSLKKDLDEKKGLLETRMKAIEKQELSMRENLERLRGDIVSKIK